MEKLNNILKQVLIFLIIFMLVNWIFSSCQDEESEFSSTEGVTFQTTKDDYSKRQTVSLIIYNNSDETLVIPDSCPEEPLDVYRYQNNEWVQKNATPELNCQNYDDLEIAKGEQIQISYDNWNNALFAEKGRFKIEFTAEIDGEEKLISSNEFEVEEEGFFRKLWDGVFYKPIYNGLIFLTSVVPLHSLGLAIILLTLIIRTIILIPSKRAMEAQKRMNELQPKLQKIKEKHKGDQQRIAMETMQLWKDAKVSPLKSCMPILLQFPFFIALFYVVQSGLNPDNNFLIYDFLQNFYQNNNFGLVDIQTNFFGLMELTENNIFVLPLIVGGLQFIQMKLALGRKNKKAEENKNSKKDKKSKDDKASDMQAATQMAGKTMIYIMPLMIAVFTATLPAGVGVYWATSNLYGIFQQIFVNKSLDSKKDKDPEPTVKVIS